MNRTTTVVFVLCMLAHMRVFAADTLQLPPEVESARTARTLTDLDVWIIPQPKRAARTVDSFDLKTCRGIRYLGAESADAVATMEILSTDLAKGSDVSLAFQAGGPDDQCILLGLAPDGKPCKELHGVSAADLEEVGTQGYAMHIDGRGVTIAARGIEGLFYGGKTLSQIATDRTNLPGVHIRDWPCLPYRGIQQDICRGQMPTMDTFKRLADVAADVKMNILELYIEHTFKFKSHPDISPPEGMSPEEGRELFEYAARQHIDVHTLFQVLGHAHHILSKPEYQHLSSGPCGNRAACTLTYDIRKPETIAFIKELIDELCETFPGKYINVDITEFNYEAFLESEETPEGVLDLIYKYVLQLNEMVKRHQMRLMITQGSLDSTGHILGVAPMLDKFPKDIMIGSYYGAGGCYQPAWEKDFPRLAEHKIDFFAQPWIYSHSRIMPWIGWAAEFSDLEISRGLAYGAKGSVTCDWGDRGNFHFTGQTWYPFVYHGASAWTGAKVDRGYFDNAFTRLFYGIDDESVARAIQMTGNISAQPYKMRDNDVVSERHPHVGWPRLLWTIDHFLGDPFTNKEIAWFAEPGQVGEQVVRSADRAARILERALGKATRNGDNIEQSLFAAECYRATGKKLIALGHCNDTQYPREAMAEELDQLVATYEELKSEFKRLWLAEARENDNFHRLLTRFDETIVPCKKKIAELRQ